LRRKYLSWFSIFLVLLFACGCSYGRDNSKKGYATVYIDGIDYDLTQDINTLGRQWAEKGYYASTSFEYVVDGACELKAYAFLPDGTLTEGLSYKDRLHEENESLRMLSIVCIGGLDRTQNELEYTMASAKHFYIRFDEEHPTSINNRYRLGDDMMELYSLKYEMDRIDNSNECLKQLNKNGIDNLLDLSERCIFDGYYTVASNSSSTSELIAVFYDGHPVDLSAYISDDLQSAYNECSEMNYGLHKYHNLYTTYPYIMDGNPNREYEYSDTYLESVGLECAFDYAYLNGAKKILAGEISEVVAVSFCENNCRFTVMKADDLLLNYDNETDKAYFQ